MTARTGFYTQRGVSQDITLSNTAR